MSRIERWSLRLAVVIIALCIHSMHINLSADESESDCEARLASERMDLMRSQALGFRFTAPEPDFPQSLSPKPLFRYDDHTRGYIDGTVWRLGQEGRPLAIVTAELHPKYTGVGPRVVYDFLSLTPVPFTARSSSLVWTPPGSAVEMVAFPDAPAAAATLPLRMVQMRRLAERIRATQEVEGQKVQLRLLPKPIDRYCMEADAVASDGAIFLLVNGRNPAIMLFLETDGEKWSYGFGRLSLPSVLIAELDGEPVWQVPAFSSNSLNRPYCAANVPVTIPGYEP
ncbi:MAG: hypothetical protein KDA75_16005 [Planctomycetaceae bacterium]|nr:hypothetical protein [Planctomycetaceae bacterium]